MTTLIQQYAQLEQQMKDIQSKMDKLQGDDRLKQELEFKDKLTELMREFGKSAAEVIALLDPEGRMTGNASPATTTRRKRKLKIFKNPNTGEVVETRGGNHKTLKAWKEEHGDETVESWLVRVED